MMKVDNRFDPSFEDLLLLIFSTAWRGLIFGAKLAALPRVGVPL